MGKIERTVVSLISWILISGISNSNDFKIENIIGVNSRKNERINSKSIDINSNIEFDENPPDAYRCSANETVSVNTSYKNEFISIAPG